jgi:CoA:oxalate CoA-transferase
VAARKRRARSYKAPGHPVRYSKTPATKGNGTPTLGEHTDALLREAGYDEVDIARVKREGTAQ